MLIVTDHLILREFEESDFEAMLAYQSDPRYLRFYEWTERTPADAGIRQGQVARLLMKHRTSLYGFIFACVRNHDDTEDILQNVSVAVTGINDRSPRPCHSSSNLFAVGPVRSLCRRRSPPSIVKRRGRQIRIGL